MLLATETPITKKVATMLCEEVAKRTDIRFALQDSMPEDNGAAITLALLSKLPKGAPPPPEGLELPTKPEGYAIWTAVTPHGAPWVLLAGTDERGILFAAGRLLRAFEMRFGHLLLRPGFQAASTPQYAIRGHQLGYRNTANSYDAWGLEQYEQYVRDLAVFGANSIELIPSLDPNEIDGPHMAMPVWDMTLKTIDMIASYGLDVWLWLPVEGDVSRSSEAQKELAQRRALFSACSRIDGLFVPGGDPGHTAPEVLMPWLGRMADVLHEYHPDAGLWVSNQGFTEEQNDVFFDYLETRRPEWLRGVVFGPWAKISLQEMRKRTPAKYRIRRYPDVSHCIRCQYPVPEWDRAFAHTLGREPVNPRPEATAHIHNSLAPYSCGFITYSDGVHDDLNKVVWTARGWDSHADLHEILCEYGRYFIQDDLGEQVAQGLEALEKNWEGPIERNAGIERTLGLWKEIEQSAGALTATNWRLEMALLRAYYDKYVKQTNEAHKAYEEEARAALARAGEIGADAALSQARAALAKADTDSVGADLRRRLEELGKALFKNIGMQLDVKRYKARNDERGAVLEFLDEALNNRHWLEAQFAQISTVGSEAGKLERIQALLNWEEPTPGAIYDDLGNAAKQPHLVRQKTWRMDPGAVASPQEEYGDGDEEGPLSWQDQAQTLFGTPLILRYRHLDPAASYRLRVTYAGRFRATMRLFADGDILLHGDLPQPEPIEPQEYAIPRSATRDGELELQWHLVDKRGCQVAEVWLLKAGQ